MQSVNKARIFPPYITFSPFRSKGRLFPTPTFSEMTQSGIPSTDSIPGISQESARIRHSCCVLTVKLSPHNHLLQLNGSKTPHHWALYVHQPIVGGKDFSSVKRDLSAWNWLEKLRSVSLNTLKAPDCRSVNFLYLL